MKKLIKFNGNRRLHTKKTGLKSKLTFYLQFDLRNAQYSRADMKFTQAKVILCIVALMLLWGCAEDPQRHLKLGKWYAQKGLVEEAILEFREVTRLYPESHQSLSRENFKTLTNAHYNLSLMYSKIGWWDYAQEEAEICFKMQPTKDHFELLELIDKRASLENSDS